MDRTFDEYNYKKRYVKYGYILEAKAMPRTYDNRDVCIWCLYVDPFKTEIDTINYPLDIKITEYGKDEFFDEVFDDIGVVTWHGDEVKPLKYGIDYAHFWQEEDRNSPYYTLPWELDFHDVPSQIIRDIGVVNKRLQYFVEKGNFEHRVKIFRWIYWKN